MLKFFVRHGMIITKSHEFISIKKMVGKNIIFKIQKRNTAKNKFKMISMSMRFQKTVLLVKC